MSDTKANPFAICQNGVMLIEHVAFMVVFDTFFVGSFDNVTTQFTKPDNPDQPVVQFEWYEPAYDEMGGSLGPIRWRARVPLIKADDLGWNVSPKAFWGEYLLNFGTPDWDIACISWPEEHADKLFPDEDYATSHFMHLIQCHIDILEASHRQFHSDDKTWSLQTGDGKLLSVDPTDYL